MVHWQVIILLLLVERSQKQVEEARNVERARQLQGKEGGTNRADDSASDTTRAADSLVTEEGTMASSCTSN